MFESALSVITNIFNQLLGGVSSVIDFFNSHMILIDGAGAVLIDLFFSLLPTYFVWQLIIWVLPL